MARVLTLFILLISTSSYSQLKLKQSTDSIFFVYHSLSMNQIQANADKSVVIKIWTDFINLYPDDFRGYEQRASTYTFMKDYKSSIDDYSKVIELRPYRYHGDYSSRGISKSYMGDNAGAISDITQAIELNPNDELYYAIRADKKIKLEDYRGSIEDLKLAIELFEKSNSSYRLKVNYYANLATSKARLNDFEGAIESYSNAIKYNIKDSYSYYHRGLTRLIVGEKESGCLDLSKAGELGYQKAYDAIKQYCR
jgi:tetratricopeptide (TPR) repeat protein